MSSRWPDVLLLQLVDPGDGRLGGDQPRLALLLGCPSPAVIPSARMSTGSVRPWRTSVAMITVKVRNWIRLRSGKSTGRARAAASETTPRMPAQRRP